MELESNEKFHITHIPNDLESQHFSNKTTSQLLEQEKSLNTRLTIKFNSEGSNNAITDNNNYSF